MSLENVPVVCSRKPRLAGVADNNALFEFAFVDLQSFPLNAISAKMDTGSSTIKGRIIILETGGHSNHSSLDICGNGDEFSLVIAIANEAVKRSNTGNGER